jgi:hypothetical protein
LKWIVEYLNGNIIKEDDYNFNNINFNSIKKIFFKNNKNKYGVNCISGNFFINNKEFNIVNKKTIMQYKIKPIQYKTARVLLNNYNNETVSWNIGYELCREYKEFEYVMTINKNNNIFISAKKFNQEGDIIKQGNKQIQ